MTRKKCTASDGQNQNVLRLRVQFSGFGVQGFGFRKAAKRASYGFWVVQGSLDTHSHKSNNNNQTA